MNWEGFIDPSLTLPGTVIPGLWGYRRCTEQEYRDFPAVNASLLKRKTPAEMYTQLTTPKKDTAALTLGTLVHMVTLEPEVSWGERFAAVDIPINPKTKEPYGQDTKKAKGAWDAAKKEHPDKIVVSPETLLQFLAECRELRDALMVHTEAMKELEGAHYEVAGFVWHEQWQCWLKWRLDYMPRGGRRMGDVKTTSKHPSEFIRDCWHYGYFIQTIWYSYCHELLLARHGMQVSVNTFTFIILSKASDDKQPRPPMARVADLKLIPGSHEGVDMARKYLGIPEGLSRADQFVACVREYLDAGQPTDFAGIRRCFPAYEQEAGESGGRFILN